MGNIIPTSSDRSTAIYSVNFHTESVSDKIQTWIVREVSEAGKNGHTYYYSSILNPIMWFV